MQRVRPLILALTATVAAVLLAAAPAGAAQPAAKSPQLVTADITMDLGYDTGSTSGSLDPTDGGALDGVDVYFWQSDGSGTYTLLDSSQVVWSGSLGSTWTATVPAGTYSVELVPTKTSVALQWYSAGDPSGLAWFFVNGTDVNATAGSSTALGTLTLPGRDFGTYRVYGQDRFGTAAAASQEMYPGSPNASPAPDVVYVANGMNYPDALAAGPAAIRNGAPLLLTFPTSLPTATANELARLHPAKVIVLGSPGAVSDAVKAAVGNAAGVSGTNLVRIGGTDRYSTGNLIVRDSWLTNGNTGSPVALIATGRNYPDALAAGPAAGYLDAPVILVDGNASSLSAATVKLLQDLGVQEVGIAGSSSVVSTGIENQLNGLLTYGAIRLAGTTRYETAQSINESIFGPTEGGFLANGLNFPDALSGAPLAGWNYAPLFLTPQACLGGPAAQGIIDLHVNGVILMGSSSVLSTDVENLAICAGVGVTYTGVPKSTAIKSFALSPLVTAARSKSVNGARLESPLRHSLAHQKPQTFTR